MANTLTIKRPTGTIETVQLDCLPFDGRTFLKYYTQTQAAGRGEILQVESSRGVMTLAQAQAEAAQQDADSQETAAKMVIWKKERAAYNRRFNEGGEGYNPYDEQGFAALGKY